MSWEDHVHPFAPSRPAGARPAVLLVLAVAAVLALSGRARAAAPCGSIGWRQPVSPAVVVDPFRPPVHIGAAGNRGWEYRTRPGAAVRAAGPGTVVFAGPIGGRRYVSVRHCDGTRTTYSYLGSVSVGAGDEVSAGTRLGTAGPATHFGVIVDGAYLDPETLFGPVGSWSGPPPLVRLVPLVPW